MGKPEKLLMPLMELFAHGAKDGRRNNRPFALLSTCTAVQPWGGMQNEGLTMLARDHWKPDLISA
jgi:hypothetical protein